MFTFKPTFSISSFTFIKRLGCINYNCTFYILSWNPAPLKNFSRNHFIKFHICALKLCAFRQVNSVMYPSLQYHTEKFYSPRKFLFTSPTQIYSFNPETPKKKKKHRLYLLSVQFRISRVLCNRNYTVYNLFTPVSLT